MLQPCITGTPLTKTQAQKETPIRHRYTGGRGIIKAVSWPIVLYIGEDLLYHLATRWDLTRVESQEPR